MKLNTKNRKEIERLITNYKICVIDLVCTVNYADHAELDEAFKEVDKARDKIIEFVERKCE